MIHPQSLLWQNPAAGGEVVEMPAAVGLLITGLIVRTVLGAIVVGAVVLFLWKAGKFLDAQTEKLKAK
jgi:hypothetical protein